jgi:hypothetical protein
MIIILIIYLFININLISIINASYHLERMMKDIETPNKYEVNGEFLGPNVILNKDNQGYSFKCKALFSATTLPFVWPPPEKIPDNLKIYYSLGIIIFRKTI